MTDTDKTGKVSSIDYRTGFLFEVKLDDDPGVFVADDTMNQTAVDVAMMHGDKVVLTVDQNGLIRRVASQGKELAAAEPATAQSVTVTRVSTQVNGVVGRMFCEVFYKDGTGDEKSVQSFDPLIERLAGSACVAEKRIGLVLDPSDDHLLVGISKGGNPVP